MGRKNKASQDVRGKVLELQEKNDELKQTIAKLETQLQKQAAWNEKFLKHLPNEQTHEQHTAKSAEEQWNYTKAVMEHNIAVRAKGAEMEKRIANLESQVHTLTTENAGLAKLLSTASAEKTGLFDTHVEMFRGLGQQTKSTIEAIELEHAEQLATQTVTHSKDIAKVVHRIKEMKVELTQRELELAKAKQELESVTDDKCDLMDSIEHERAESEGLRLQVKDLEAELEKRTSTEVEIKDEYTKRFMNLWRLKVAWYGMQREAALDVSEPDEVLAVYEENRRWQRYINVERVLRRAFRSFSEFPMMSLDSQKELDKSTKCMFFAWWHTACSNAKMETLVRKREQQAP